MIEQAEAFTEYIAVCSNKHRMILEHLDVDFSETPDRPSDGWPTHCKECGVEMVYGEGMENGWHTKMGSHYWVNPATGVKHRDQHDHGPGAMFYLDWSTRVGPDGKTLAVVLPPGGEGDLWIIDDQASGGGHWTRTGVAPLVTADPSILTPRYHGHLQNGVLTNSYGDRPLPPGPD